MSQIIKIYTCQTVHSKNHYFKKKKQNKKNNNTNVYLLTCAKIQGTFS